MGGEPLGCLCSMYLLGKAKSLSEPDWLWRGICAIPRPLINKRSLRIAARAMTTFLRLVTSEIAGNVLVHRVSQVSSWLQQLKAALKLPSGLCLLQASGCVQDAKGNIGWLAIAWGLGFLASASCTAERRLLALDMLCLSCLMNN